MALLQGLICGGDGGVQSTQLCLTLYDPMDLSTPSFPDLHHLLELAQTHIHQVGDTIQPSQPLSSPSLAVDLS